VWVANIAHLKAVLTQVPKYVEHYKTIIYLNSITSYMGTKQELVQFWREKKVDEDILRAFQEVPREIFVPPQLQEHAYDDHPLPTIRNQSISQPSTIVMMMQALELAPGDNVFEIGAGAGYQASLISKVIGPQGSLVTLDIIPELVQMAKENMKKQNIENVQVIEADGSEGYPQEAPFDKVIITAACPTIPQPVIDQMKEGGIVVAPVGDLDSQTMIRGTKENGKLELEFLGPFRFVPMRGKYGFKEAEMFYN
jgi:protein-L-isoaspartate(D-aspartate) O-methyltransferase